MNKGIRLAVLVLINLGVLLVFVELAGLALFYEKRGTLFYTSGKQPQTSEVPAHYQTKRVIFHPYFGYVNHPERTDDPVLGTNNHGFQVHRLLLDENPRCCDYPYRGSADEVLVGIFGGSVGIGFSRAAQASTRFADLLVSRIPRYKGKRVRILNFALSAYKQPQQAITLAYYLSLGQRFDIVINIDGFNETVNTLQNWTQQVEPTFPADAIWGAMGRAIEAGQVPGGRGDDLLALYHQRAAEQARQNAQAGCRFAACFLTQTALESWHAWRSAKLVSATRDRTEHISWFPMSRRGTLGKDIDIAEYTADRWRDSSILMARMLAGTGTTYLHVLQPNQWFKPSFDYKPKRQDHIYGWVIDPVNRFYPAYLRRADSLRAAKVEFLDATTIFKGRDRDTIFEDDCCHYSMAGYDVLFDAVAERLRRMSSAGSGKD